MRDENMNIKYKEHTVPHWLHTTKREWVHLEILILHLVTLLRNYYRSCLFEMVAT